MASQAGFLNNCRLCLSRPAVEVVGSHNHSGGNASNIVQYYKATKERKKNIKWHTTRIEGKLYNAVTYTIVMISNEK